MRVATPNPQPAVPPEAPVRRPRRRGTFFSRMDHPANLGVVRTVAGLALLLGQRTGDHCALRERRGNYRR